MRRFPEFVSLIVSRTKKKGKERLDIMNKNDTKRYDVGAMIKCVLRGLIHIVFALCASVGFSYFVCLYIKSNGQNADIDVMQLACHVFRLYIFTAIGYFGAIMFLSNDKEPKQTTIIEKEMPSAKLDKPHTISKWELNELKPTCIHEAGHGLMLYLVGIDDIKIHIDRFHSWTSANFPGVGSTDCLRKMVMVYYSSIAAQRILGCETSGFFGNENTQSDYEKANATLHSILLIENHELPLTCDDDQTRELMESLSKELYAETEQLLLEHKSDLEQLTDLLIKSRYADEQDIHKILHESK